MGQYILSSDLGTSAIKTALFDENGRMAGVSNIEHKLETPSSLEVELDVESYWDAFKQGIRDVLVTSGVSPEDIKVFGFSVQGETLTFLGDDMRPLRRCVRWVERGAHAQSEELAKAFKHADYYEITGQFEFIPTWPASKILWFRQNQPDLFEQTANYLLLEDYFIFRLTGKLVAEGSLLCSTMYWDIRKKTYWKEMLDYLGVRENQLPEIRESGDIVGTIMPEIAVELGLSPETEICTGVLDQAAGAIGVGNIAPGVFSECSGTALAIVSTVDHAFKDDNRLMPCFYHGIRNRYMAHIFGAGGMVLKWFRDNMASFELAWQEFSGQDAYVNLDKEAAQVPPGSEGLLTLPHFQGAASPENNPRAKGVFYGVTLGHTKGHFVRSILESIGYSTRRIIDILKGMDIAVEEVRALGGGAKSPVWLQIKADILGVPVVTMENEEAASLGAAIVAGVAAGIYPSIEEAVERMIRIKDRYEPNVDNTDVYDRQYRKYIELYETLEPLFDSERK